MTTSGVHHDVVERHRALLDAVPTGIWIDNASRTAATARTFVVDDPATGRELTQVADAGPDDAMLALKQSVAAADDWAATSPRERSVILRAAFDLITERAADLALLMTLEMGKALPDSKSEIAYGAEFLRWFSEEAVRINGRYTQSPGGTGRILVTHQPVGPCLAITPWNFPLAMGTRKIGPALAAGNTIIVKPAAETPLTMLALAKIFAEAGLPPGVLAVLPTSDASAVCTPLIEDTRIRKITFTGSTGVGRILLGQAAANVQRTSMELGGNAPFIVFDDADLDAALDGAFAAKMRNGGEACTAANRFLVHDSVAEEFTDGLIARMQALTVGPGYADGTTLGPLISEKQRNSVAQKVTDAVADGARVRLGGEQARAEQHGGDGWFYPPTVLDEVPVGAEITRGEIFGPVAVISTFGTVDEAIAAANDTEYGLAAYIYTRDLDRALSVSDRLQTGLVGVNRGVISDVAAPFGGEKQSGLGREGGLEGIGEFLTTKYVALTS
ncbi:NAD-dependent succinate-semialdehyde dehydrogenase [Williamsia sterculiae]|uniref:Succinate-semialdehyde dehydrogenase / glutarate-semialdehyde dehydrogenase n=1 Tax=Williamsia sterculiae TaxID=1344003 RepID=A0A1N7CX19_9NOCA|nr:NAD-dependent succinate-semialdehyde dehydrogenase [Williamsia sterculiae]SIR68090.1 succinate-semialdehyde dehydrogenase / glutarate-semialdehyde dehydrogenase [Williamsia sterculiae]